MFCPFECWNRRCCFALGIFLLARGTSIHQLVSSVIIARFCLCPLELPESSRFVFVR